MRQTGVVTEETLRDVDWYGEELGSDVTRERTLFVDGDLTEVITRGATFVDCTFRNVRFNVSRHHASAFLRCTFSRCNFFEARFEGCKLTGSRFEACDFALLKVERGDWSFTDLSGATLEGARFEEVRLRESDLTHARCARACFVACDLSGSSFHGADLTDAVLTGSDLAGLDPLSAKLAGAVVDPRQAEQIVGALGLTVVPG